MARYVMVPWAMALFSSAALSAHVPFGRSALFVVILAAASSGLSASFLDESCRPKPQCSRSLDRRRSHLWPFDLLTFNGRYHRLQPLVTQCLQVLLERFGCPPVPRSELFEDGLALLRMPKQRGLEGVVRKRRDTP